MCSSSFINQSSKNASIFIRQIHFKLILSDTGRILHDDILLQESPSQYRRKHCRAKCWADMTCRTRWLRGLTRGAIATLALRCGFYVCNRDARDAGAVLAFVVGEELGSRVEHDVGALSYLSDPAGLANNKSHVNTYVVQCASGVAKLNDLDGSHESVDALVVEARVASSLEPGFEVCTASFL